MNNAIIKQPFTEKLVLMKMEKQTEITQFEEENRHDEAKFSKIELNIIEIFEKMFEASQKAGGGKKEGLTSAGEQFLGYFEKIPGSWKVNLEKCEAFGHDEEAHIERLKLAQADAVKALYLECCSVLSEPAGV